MGSAPKKKVRRYTQPVQTAARFIFSPSHFEQNKRRESVLTFQ